MVESITDLRETNNLNIYIYILMFPSTSTVPYHLQLEDLEMFATRKAAILSTEVPWR